MRKLDIGIVGAGVAGLAAATMLSRSGHRVTVLERFDAPGPVGSGLMLQPPGLVAMERLGCRSEIEELGERVEHLHGLTARGTTIFKLWYRDLHPDLYALAVHRAALHGVLWDAFAKSGADLVCSRGVASADMSSTRPMLIDSAQGAVGPFDLVVDASGSRSPLRVPVSGCRVRQFGYGAVWATIPDKGVVERGLGQRYVGARRMAGYLPVGRIQKGGPRHAALFWSLRPEHYEMWRDGYDEWLGEIVALWPELAPVVADLPGPEVFTLASYTHCTPRRLSRGAVVLVGDSAHATSPQLGQGANHGMIDAVVLADCIDRATDMDEALAAYQRARHRHVRFYQLASWLMTPFFQSDSRVLPVVRDLTFHHLRLLPFAHAEMLRTLAGLKTGILTSATPDDIVNGGP